jgi:hypothetical protein
LSVWLGMIVFPRLKWKFDGRLLCVTHHTETSCVGKIQRQNLPAIFPVASRRTILIHHCSSVEDSATTDASQCFHGRYSSVSLTFCRAASCLYSKVSSSSRASARSSQPCRVPARQAGTSRACHLLLSVDNSWLAAFTPPKERKAGPLVRPGPSPQNNEETCFRPKAQSPGPNWPWAKCRSSCS